ncbi:MAG: response regulator [Candidatus Omnitrophica bacterium]|nr:response regulator [Candidatus Omnitrophota bacterium]
MAKILIVDDIVEYVESLKNILKSEYEIVVAYSLKEAKEKADKTFSLFLVDIRLDESDPKNIDGIIFLEWAKKNFPEIPVIIMSAYKEFEEKKEEIIARGAEKFLKKPIDIINLKEIIKEFIM